MKKLFQFFFLFSVIILLQNNILLAAIEDTVVTENAQSISNDTTILFEENFNDGDFTNNPAWDKDVNQRCAPQPANFAIIDGVLQLSQKNATACGTYAQLYIDLNIPVTDSTTIQFDVKPSYSSVDEGAGYSNSEYPVSIYLRLLNLKNEFMDIRFCYNYRGGGSSYQKDYIKHVFPFCDQDKWIRNEVYRIKDFFPNAKTIIQLQVKGNGWDYEGYADNIKIFDSKRIIDTKLIDELALEPFDLDTTDKSRHIKAIEFYRKNLNIATFTKNIFHQVIYLKKIGERYFQLNTYDSAMIYFQNTIIACKKIADPKIFYYITGSYFQLSIIYSLRNEYDSALFMLDTLSGIYQKANDTTGITFALNEKAGIYYLTGDINKAVNCYQEVLKLNRTHENTTLIARTLQKLGNLYLHENMHQKALEIYLKAYEINKKIGDLNSVAILLLDIGNIYFILNKYDDAIKNLNKSLETAKMRNLESLLNDIYFKYSEIYFEKGDTTLYYQYYSKYSISIINKDQALAEQYVKYKTEKVGQENKLLRKDNEIQELNIKQKSNQLYLSIAIGGLVLILVVIIYSRYLAKQKANILLAEQKEQLKKFNTELVAKNELISGQKKEIEQNIRQKETMLRELHHRVKNNLQIIYSMLSLQSKKLKDKDAISAIEANIHRVWAMALIHHKLYLDDNLTKINMPQYINELSSNILDTYTPKNQEIKLKLDIEDIELEADIAIPLGLIINELTSNALKHAFDNVSEPEIKIKLEAENKHNLVLNIKDNGTGISEDNSNNSGSFGLELINMLVKQLKGELEITSKKGTCITLTIPLKTVINAKLSNE